MHNAHDPENTWVSAHDAALSGLSGFVGQPGPLLGLGFVQCSKVCPELVADRGVGVAGQLADAGLGATALLGDLHLCEPPIREV